MYHHIDDLAGRIKNGFWIAVHDHRSNPDDVSHELRTELKNAPYFLSTISAALLDHLQDFLGAGNFSIYNLDDHMGTGEAKLVAPLKTRVPVDVVSNPPWYIGGRRIRRRSRQNARRPLNESPGPNCHF